MFQNGTGQERPSATKPVDRRGTKRREHAERVAMVTQWGTLAGCLLDLSTTGAQVRVANGLIPIEGDEVTLRLVDGHHLSGSIVWSEQGALGISFEQQVPSLDDLLWLEQRGPDWFYGNVRAQR